MSDIPSCYRHPGRETYVRCGRCERYICPDDMISAAVGFQCPECVRGGNKGVREARTVTGGAVRANTGLLTTGLITTNLVIFLAVQGSPELLERMLLAAYSGQGDGVAEGGVYRLVSAMFLHQETFHIALNMIVLWMFGRPLEAQLGRSRFLLTYLITGLGGSTASYLFNSPQTASLGASGAVFGVIGALLVVERRFGSDRTGAVIYLAILLLPGILIPNIDWRGHIGGLVTGMALGVVYAYAPRGRRLLWHVGAMAAVLLVLVGLVGARTEQLRERYPTARAEVVHTVDNSCAELQPCHFGV